MGKKMKYQSVGNSPRKWVEKYLSLCSVFFTFSPGTGPPSNQLVIMSYPYCHAFVATHSCSDDRYMLQMKNIFDTCYIGLDCVWDMHVFSNLITPPHGHPAKQWQHKQ